MNDVAAIIVAGGQGVRFGGRVRKQYLSLRGKPIVWWSLQAFEKAASIDDIYLVVPSDDVPAMTRRCKPWRLRKLRFVTAGGATRADSVRAGLRALPTTIRWVAVHDAVRPLVTPLIIEKTLTVARRSRAAIAACPSRDTVKLAGVGRSPWIHQTPPRESVWLAQTPQIFERSLLERAHAKGRHLTATDDAFLVERLGARVSLVEAPSDNIKVTLPVDLRIAKEILKSRKKSLPL